jgi:tellurite methyltransferase
MQNYKAYVSLNGIAALQAFVKKPFIGKPPEKHPIEHFWQSGELFTHFHDWYIEQCSEYVFDCNSSGIPHKHAANRLFARKIKTL